MFDTLLKNCMFDRPKRVLGLCYVVVKVALLSVVEIGVFPLIGGWWLDICSLSLFDATLKVRLKHPSVLNALYSYCQDECDFDIGFIHLFSIHPCVSPHQSCQNYSSTANSHLSVKFPLLSDVGVYVCIFGILIKFYHTWVVW